MSFYKTPKWIHLVGFAAVLAGVLLIAREHAKHH